jgi:hypothetical protein
MTEGGRAMEEKHQYELNGELLTIWVKRSEFVIDILPRVLDEILMEIILPEACKIRRVEIEYVPEDT